MKLFCHASLFVICAIQLAVTEAWAGCGTPRADLRINNQATGLNGRIKVCPNGPIILDGSQSNCAEKHFISIELSDQSWNRKGGELTHWYSPRDDEHLYGKISHFDLKSWAEHNYFHFVPPVQFYRVKLGIGPYWRETSQLIEIDSPRALVAVNGVGPFAPGQVVDIPGPAHNIVLGGGSFCADR
jgi:hypothetical protein